MIKACTVPGCERTYRSRGYCLPHLRRALEAGEDPSAPRTPRYPASLCRIVDCLQGSLHPGPKLCGMHYQRLRNHGSPEIPLRITLKHQFDQSYDVIDGCWIWTGAVASTGYGKIRGWYAHRVSYQLFIGRIPVGYQIDHLCRVPACVSPAHLEAVTQGENLKRQWGSGAIGRCVACGQYTPGDESNHACTK